MVKRGRFHRPSGTRRYRKLFVIAVEGANTEPQYFSVFRSREAVVSVKCLPGKSSSAPRQVLKRMQEYLRKSTLRNSDEAWLVVDRDHWTDEQLTQLFEWSTEKDNYGFALSNPNFEYWLLLHFEDGTSVTGARQCTDRLRQYLPDYDKTISAGKVTRERIKAAVARAKKRDNPPCSDWPRKAGSTTVYRLVEQILKVEPPEVDGCPG